MNCDSIREFIIDSLRAMNYDVAGIDNDTELGPRGADLESLALAELAIRVEDRFAVTFDENEADELRAADGRRVLRACRRPDTADSAVTSLTPR